jgi:hypothetical protein
VFLTHLREIAAVYGSEKTLEALSSFACKDKEYEYRLCAGRYYHEYVPGDYKRGSTFNRGQDSFSGMPPYYCCRKILQTARLFVFTIG